MTAAQVVTPHPLAFVRRWRFWVGVAVVVIGLAVVTLVVEGTNPPGAALSPDNPAPAGARALAQVLRAQGVDVEVADGLDAAVEGLGAGDATLLLHDPGGILDRAALRRLDDAADRVVLVDPSDSTLSALAPGVMASGSTSAPASADCADPDVERAGAIAGDARVYRVSGDVIGCWADGDGGYRMALADGGHIVVVGTTGALSNEQIVLSGNAAFALGLLGHDARLVWFQPTLADAPEGAPPSLGSLSPGWVILFALLAVAVVVAAAVWQGRRFGPLVVEPLPAVVRADETMRGRARLYARAAARLRAADALRIGAADRAAAALGLPASASAEEVAAAIAKATGRPRAAVLDLLVERVPGRDAELVRLANELAALERDVRRAVGGNGTIEPGE